jgi:hypothetical protein
MSNFTHLLLEDQHRAATKGVFGRFTESLRQLSADIDERNKRRRWPTDSLNPRQLYSSVSI